MMSVQKGLAQKDIASAGAESYSFPVKNDPATARTASDTFPGYPDYFTRSTSQTLKAIAIILVVFSHFYPLCIAGELGVVIFLIVSGMGLTKSYGFSNCGKQYIKRRLSKILISLWLTLVLFYILDFFLLGATYPWHEIALSFAGIIKQAPPNAPLWFIPFILYLYVVYFLISNIRLPLLFKCILLILTSFGTTAFIIRVPLLFDYFGGWTIYTFAFPLSVCLMAYRHSFIGKIQILSKRFGPFLFVIWLAMAGSFVILPTAKTCFLVALIAISIFYLDRVESKPKFVLFLGEHSYETYLIHLPLLSSYGFVLGREPAAFFVALYCGYLLLLAVALKKAGIRMSELLEI